MLVTIALITYLTYSGSLKNRLTNWDDQEYVSNNKNIQELSKESIKKEFSNFHMGNYHPLTMLSYAIEYKYSELDTTTFHTTNLLIHILNSLLVFLFIYLLTKNNIISFTTSALFAIHPMHVESVAWVAERKDLLYTFFYLATLCVYLKYKSKPGILLYLGMLLLFICSLLSKGMGVTLPIVLVLIDYFQNRKINFKNIAEKIPFFAIALAFGIIAIYAQESAKAIGELKTYTVFERFLFVNYSIVMYIWKAIAPFNLSAFYDYPVKNNNSYPSIFYLSPIINLAIGVLCFMLARNNRKILFGIGFFLATIFIVLQILPVGGAIIADRYTYIPYIGLFFLVGILFDRMMSLATLNRNVVYAILSSVILLFSYTSNQRCKVWGDSITLWNDVLSKETSSPKAFNNRGDAYNIAKNYELAIEDLNKSIKLKYDYPDALYNRGLSYYYLKNYDQAIADYTSAIKYNPSLAVAYFNRSGTYYALQKYQLALDDALKSDALGKEVDPKYIEALRQGVKIIENQK